MRESCEPPKYEARVYVYGYRYKYIYICIYIHNKYTYIIYIYVYILNTSLLFFYKYTDVMLKQTMPVSLYQ